MIECKQIDAERVLRQIKFIHKGEEIFIKRRTKIATILTTGLLSAALVGVGFAAWQIGVGNNDDDKKVNGNIKADEVTVEGLGYTVATSGPANIIFGKTTKTGAATYSWLSNAEGTEQSLSFDITVTLNKGSFAKLTLEAKVGGEDLATKLNTLTTGGYITGPKYTSTDLAEVQTEAQINETTGEVTFKEGEGLVVDSEAQSFTITVTFGWGVRFGGLNPINFFNQKNEGAAMSEYDDVGTGFSAATYEATETVNYVFAEKSLNTLYTELGNSAGLTATFTYTAQAVAAA